MRPGDWSPNGGEIAGVRCSNEFQCDGVIVYTLATESYRLLTETGGGPRWTKDGRFILYAAAGSVDLIDTRTGQARQILKREGNDIPIAPVMSPDQKTLYFNSANQRSDLWLAEAQ